MVSGMARSTLTSKATLTRLIDGARRAGHLDQLYWFVEMRVSPSLTGAKGAIIAAATYPPGWTPIIPVAPDPQLSRHYAEMLMELLKRANRGRLIEFGLALTAAEIIAEEATMPTYEWGDACWDCVCVFCGAVWAGTGTHEEVCEGCRQPFGVG